MLPIIRGETSRLGVVVSELFRVVDRLLHDRHFCMQAFYLPRSVFELMNKYLHLLRTEATKELEDSFLLSSDHDRDG